jgi:hypothetical protein
MLVITDAGTVNSNSVPRVEQELKLIDEFVQNDVPVYSLNVVDGNQSPAWFLFELTVQTGGSHFIGDRSHFPVDGGANAIAWVAARICVEERNLYELEYTPKNTAHDGAYRAVQVELITPRGPPLLKVGYRPGYYESRR